MTSVFIGGSRAISRLNDVIRGTPRLLPIVPATKRRAMASRNADNLSGATIFFRSRHECILIAWF